MTGVAAALKRRELGDRLVRRNPLVYPRALAAFDRLESAGLEERRAFTDARLRTVLAVAARSRYGRSVGGGARVGDWPLLGKERVRDEPGSFLGRGARLAARATTSGTTGTPLRLRRSLGSLAVEQAAVDRLARAHGIDLASARVAVLRGDDLGELGSGPLWRDDASGRRRVFASNMLAADTLPVVADGLERFGPHCLLAYPSVLESLCLLLGARRLVVPLTLTSSEVLPERSRRLAEDVLGTRVVDLYGQAERVAFASSSGDGYTFLPGYSYLELVPAEGSDGETFEIVGTSLWNLAMPLVRYRTGDLVTLHTPATEDVLDEVRYGLRPVSRIAGRSDDFLVGPDGARLVGIDHIPRGVDNVVRVQIVQEDRDVVIRVLAKPGFGAGDALQLEANARRKLPPGIRWSIEVVDTLERSSNGKTPFVIRRAGS